MLDEGLHDLVAVGHVRHHVGHVVLGRPHQRGAEHQRQVPGLHLPPEPGQSSSPAQVWGASGGAGDSQGRGGVGTLFFSEWSAMVFR